MVTTQEIPQWQIEQEAIDEHARQLYEGGMKVCMYVELLFKKENGREPTPTEKNRMLDAMSDEEFDQVTSMSVEDILKEVE